MNGEEKTFVAEVTQYLRPYGRQVLHYPNLPKEVETFYNDMVKHGSRLTAEVLITSQISLTVTGPMPEHPEMEDDLDIVIVPNGLRVQAALVDMLKRQKWRRTRC